ncbi:hypothetical protein [Acinetobacter baumannii]|nr:hypothetical protein [Acinetobacter baumannii]
MSVKSIFIQTHAPHQSRLVHGFDSMVNSKHPANTALPSGPISLNLVPT